MVLRTILTLGWSPILITVLAVVGYQYEWPIESLASILVIILIIGLVIAVISTREKDMEKVSWKLRQIAGYFSRRFLGDSSLSIFAIIEALFKVDNPKLWNWARACDMSQRVFNTWSSSFVSRVESDVKARSFRNYLRTYLNEFWLMSSHYHEFVEQFYEVAGSIELPQEIVEQYNRFVAEYNVFVQNFQDTVSELKKYARTEIEPPSIKFARELSAVKPPPAQRVEEKPKQPPRDNKGYYL